MCVLILPFNGLGGRLASSEKANPVSESSVVGCIPAPRCRPAGPTTPHVASSLERDDVSLSWGAGDKNEVEMKGEISHFGQDLPGIFMQTSGAG